MLCFFKGSSIHHADCFSKDHHADWSCNSDMHAVHQCFSSTFWCSFVSLYAILRSRIPANASVSVWPHHSSVWDVTLTSVHLMNECDQKTTTAGQPALSWTLKWLSDVNIVLWLVERFARHILAAVNEWKGSAQFWCLHHSLGNEGVRSEG